MRYEEPRMEVLELEAEDIITSSTLVNDGPSTGEVEEGTDMGNIGNW